MENHSYGSPRPSVHITCVKGFKLEVPPMAIGGLVGFDSS